MKEDFFSRYRTQERKVFLKNVVLAIHLQQFIKFYWCLYIVINSYYQMEPTQNLQDKIERMSV